MVLYPYSIANCDPGQLAAEISALGLPGFDGVLGFPGGVKIEFVAALTQAQVNSLSAKVAAHVPNPLATLRAAADAYFAANTDRAQVALRAVVLVMIDEINLLRARLRAQDAAVAAAATMAALKTNWAALAAVPDRTGPQAKAAVTAKIDSAAAD